MPLPSEPSAVDASRGPGQVGDRPTVHVHANGLVVVRVPVLVDQAGRAVPVAQPGVTVLSEVRAGVFTFGSFVRAVSVVLRSQAVKGEIEHAIIEETQFSSRGGRPPRPSLKITFDRRNRRFSVLLL